jgi:hypothetical protein
MRSLLLSLHLFLLPLLLAGQASAADEPRIAIEPRERRALIRSELLAATPLGSTPQQVLDFINQRLKQTPTLSPAIENKPAGGASAEKSRERGVKRIKIDLADYLTEPATLTLTIPIPIVASVWVPWAFDRDDRLIEIFVDREIR